MHRIAQDFLRTAAVEDQNKQTNKQTNKLLEKMKDLYIRNWWLGPVGKKSTFSSKYYNQQKFFNVSVEQWQWSKLCGGTTEEGRERANKERKTGGRSAV